jgi:hypothetical protein
LSEDAQREALAPDAVIGDRGNLMSAVQAKGTTVRNGDKNLEVADEPLAEQPLPRAGFSVIEAKRRDEAVKWVSTTPCARARGAIEIRSRLGWSPFMLR